MLLLKYRFLLFFLLSLSAVKSQKHNSQQFFLSQLDSIRTSLQIPGMAVAVTEGDSFVIKSGLGYADLKYHIKVTPNTTFRIASITKTFTSTILMQMVEQGKLNLDTSISAFGLDFGNPNITVRNILTHTSEGEPGSFFQYNGYRFSFLQKVIEQTTGMPLYQLLMERIVQPLGMASTAPSISLVHYFQYRQQRKDMMPLFDTAFTHLATPYDVDKGGTIGQTAYLDEFGSSGGLVTSVVDLVKYAAAIDKHQFVNAQTQAMIFTPNRTKKGEATPYGLGWFTQNYRGIDFYWHYGHYQGESGLFVKVPSMKLTMAVLTNSVRLSSPFPLGDGDLFMSPVGQLFYKCFLSDDKALSDIDFSQPISELRKEIAKNFKSEYIDFYNKEMISQATLYNINGDTTKAKNLYHLYAELNFKDVQPQKRHAVIAALNQVGINQEVSKSFALTQTTKISVLGVGENCSDDFKSWCDYGWIEDANGKVVWQMQSQPAIPAGGAKKNQKVETTVILPAGHYTIKYKSDWAHAYNNWDSLPPDNLNWGITVFKSD